MTTFAENKYDSSIQCKTSISVINDNYALVNNTSFLINSIFAPNMVSL